MGSSQTEVQNFQGTVTPDDDVRRLQVLKGRHGIRSAEVAYPVDDAGLVEMSDAAEHLVEEVGEALVVEVHLDHLKRGRLLGRGHALPGKDWHPSAP